MNILVLSIFVFGMFRLYEAGTKSYREKAKSEKRPSEVIVFWTTEVEKNRMEIQKILADEFLKKQGIYVKVVPVGENLLAERVTAASAARPQSSADRAGWA